MAGAFSESEFSAGDSRPIRVLLDAGDFRTLVSGGVVLAGGVEIALGEIGFKALAAMVLQAWRKSR